ncbi:helix-turn-helix domain-containing protein [Brevibacillus sp. 179-C9.3 HS]|uniref:helix-turn-helix domain-containing protein n=1 Tax=unclassified Brevibacillus TaxID=2684853 RepID=UPI0039A2A9FE
MTLVTLVKRAQNNEAYAVHEIVRMFEPKIKRTLRLVNREEKEDIRQEISLKIIEAVLKYNFRKAPRLDFIKLLHEKKRLPG